MFLHVIFTVDRLMARCYIVWEMFTSFCHSDIQTNILKQAIFFEGPTCCDVMVIITDNFIQCFIICDRNEYFVPSQPRLLIVGMLLLF
jgi:hypothetical protein